jgi:O-antigen/teichoic acid export membrane protein
MATFVTSWYGTALLIAATTLAAAALVFISRSAPRLGAPAQHDQFQRVFRNSAVPIVSQLFVRFVDLGVAVALLRLLGPAGNGQYALAVVIWLYVKTVSDFGLSLLATREIVKDPERSGPIIGATTLFRWFALLVCLVPVALYLTLRLDSGSIEWNAAVAIGLLLLSVIPSSYGEAINAALNGWERMDVAAWVNVGVTLVRAPLAVLLGATSLGVSGVALAALVTSTLSTLAFRRVLHELRPVRVTWRLDRGEAMFYARESWPLLINALLISLFFRVDVFVIDAFRGDAALGIYDAAYKFINLVTIVPAYATLALFPLLVQRVGDQASMARAYRSATYLLVCLSWPIVAGTAALAGVLMLVLAGRDYLPDSAYLLRILIWFAPLSFFNGVYQYVLVASGRQRSIAPVFVAAVVFNLTGNLLFVDRFGTSASALITVLTEVLILLLFIRMRVPSVVPALDAELARRLWRPTVAGVLATAVAFLLRDSAWLALAASLAVLVGIAVPLRVVGPDERRVLSRVALLVRR